MEGYFKNKYCIESARLRGWDYSSKGYYFITICTREHEYFFGSIVDNKMVLNEKGKIASYFWLEIINNFKNIKLDEFIIIPNHVHFIIIINNLLFEPETHAMRLYGSKVILGSEVIRDNEIIQESKRA